MAFDRNAAKAAGYTDQEINQYLQNNGAGQSQQNNQPNFFQGLLGALRGWGAGAVQDIAAPTWMAGQEIAHGQSPVAGIGNQANANQLQQYAKSNPFANQQQLQQMGGSVPQAATQVAKDTAGAASWLMPMSAGGALARGALGATQGALNGVSQDGANPTSVGTNAVTSAGMNMVNPLIAKGFQSAWGRIAFGPGGDKFGDIVNAVGPVTGGTKTLGNNLYNKMQPVRDAFDTLLGDSTGGIPKSKIFGSTTLSGAIDPENPGIVGNIMNNVGISSRDAANEYVKKLQQHMDTLHSQYLENQGIDRFHILPLVQNQDLPTPLPVIQNFLHDLGGDTKVFQNNSPVGAMAKQLYGEIRGRVANASGDPAQYNKLQGLKKAGAQIGQNLAEGTSTNPLMKLLGSRLEKIGINGSLGLGLGASALLGHPWTLLPGAAAEAAIQPKVASAGISFANSPLGKILGLMGRKTISSGAGNVMTTPQ